MSETSIRSLDVVAVTEDIPAHGLVRGNVGTVVEWLAPGVFEIEFTDNEGRTYASCPLPIEKLLVLHHEQARGISARS